MPLATVNFDGDAMDRIAKIDETRPASPHARAVLALGRGELAATEDA